MTERSIVDAAARLRRHGEPYLVATVVSAHGAAYRRPGARMILTRFRWVAGTVTGGYLDGDLANAGWAGTQTGAPLLVSYDGARTAADDDDLRSAFGLGTDGPVDVLVERAGLTGRIDALEVCARCHRAQRRGAVMTVFRSTDPAIRVGARLALVEGGELEQESDPLADETREVLAGELRVVLETCHAVSRTIPTANGAIDVLFEAIAPPPRLFLLGTGHDAVPVAQLAHQLGWDVIVCAADARFSIRERFGMATEVVAGTPAELVARIDESDRAIVVVMTHDRDRDRAYVAMALATRARYVGALGPITSLGGAGGSFDDARLHAPVARALGADTPQEIALALVADVQATLLRTTPAADRCEPASPPHERATASRPSAVLAAVAVS